MSRFELRVGLICEIQEIEMRIYGFFASERLVFRYTIEKLQELLSKVKQEEIKIQVQTMRELSIA